MVGKITEQGITIRQGDSFVIKLHFKDEISAKDLTGYSVKMQVCDEQKQSMFIKTADISNPLDGEAVLNLGADETSIPTGTYFTDIQICDEQGNVHTIYPQNVNTVAFFKITEQITI